MSHAFISFYGYKPTNNNSALKVPESPVNRHTTPGSGYYPVTSYPNGFGYMHTPWPSPYPYPPPYYNNYQPARIAETPQQYGANLSMYSHPVPTPYKEYRMPKPSPVRLEKGDEDLLETSR